MKILALIVALLIASCDGPEPAPSPEPVPSVAVAPRAVDCSNPVIANAKPDSWECE